MAQYVFKLPDVGEGVAEAEVVAWHVKIGERVAEDQALVDVMTDKATVEMTSPVAGVLVSRCGEEGDLTPVGAPIAVIELDADASAPVDAEPAAEALEAEPEMKPADAPVVAHGDALASPAVRKRAAALRVDLAVIAGSGPAGRVEHADLDAILLAGRTTPAPADRSAVQEVKVIGLRRRIAEKMQEAKRRIPHFSYVEEVDVTELEALRAHLNATAAPGQPKLSLPPFLIRALARVAPNFPQINALYDDEAGIVRRYAALHVGIAVQTDDGLMVPVVRDAQALDVWSLAAEIGRLAAAARSGQAERHELSGSTITLTSLGALGGVVSTPVINHPEVAILCPNRIVERVVVQGGQMAVRKMMNLSSSFDHRVVDGYDAAAFIQAMKQVLEHPATMFMGA